jgi:predicted amidohydrolase YtcJ
MPGRRTALLGGKVWTAGYGAPRRLDVLVDDGRILQVGRSGEVDASGARVVDTTGRLLLPGLQDAHLHPGLGGADLLTCDLADCTTSEQVLERIRSYAATLPRDAWVTGGGWDRALFPRGGPTRQQLDEVTGGRPAWMRSYDCHGVWVSSEALRIAGVDATTVDPEHGYVVRDPGGNPTGLLEEDAMALVRRHLPPETTESQKRSILRAQEHLVALGVTSVQDAIVGGGLGMPDQLPAYRDLLSERRLTCRLTAALWWDPTRGLDQLDDLRAQRQSLEACADPAWVVADTVKLMVDGSHTVFLDQEVIREATVALDARGLTCHYHSYGELATRWVLDAVAEARAVNSIAGGRHHIAHLMVIAEDDFARFAPLDVTANVQAAWGYSAVAHSIMQLTTCSDDPERREYAFGRLLAAGARLAAGSDWPVTTADPLEAIRLECGRGRERTPAGAVGDPDELDRLDLGALLTAYTTGSAHVNGRASTTGRIAPGFLADLALLDRDPFADEESLREVAVAQTWVDGRCVHDADTEHPTA